MEDIERNPANTEMKDEPEKVAVPAKVLQGINAVRYSGLTNMLDRPMVAKLAKTFGFPETATWIKNHPKAYAEGIFHGFAVKSEE